MSLELYIGPMFAGKSTEILRIIRRNKIIGRNTLCITSALDKRYSADPKIMSHDQDSCSAIAVHSLKPLFESQALTDAETIIIEEAQFFPDLFDFVLVTVDVLHKHVICVGLDGDSSRRPFGQILDLIPHCDAIHKLKALCKRCSNGTEALFTYRRPDAPTAQINVGMSDQYEPLCRDHYLEMELDKIRDKPDEIYR